MSSNRERVWRNALTNLSAAIISFEGMASNVQISDDALTTWQAKVSEFTSQPYVRIIERQEPQAATNLAQGLITVSGSACNIAKSEGRSIVTGSDVERAVESNFCHVWPFCR
jgi:hypothetical protein